VAMAVAVFPLRRVPRDAVPTPGSPQSGVAPGSPLGGAPQSTAS
jgi:hypothetical protein